MKYLSILLTVVTLTLLVGVAKAELPNVRPMKTPLAKKIRNVLWQKGVHGTLSYQALHGKTPVIVDLSEKKNESNQKKEEQAVLPEELIQALHKSRI